MSDASRPRTAWHSAFPRLVESAGVPNDWKEAALFATENHMRVHPFQEMRAMKLVALREAVSKNSLSVDGLVMIRLIDVLERGDPEADHPASQGVKDLWRRMKKSVNGRTISLNGVQGAAVGETIQQARARFFEHECQHPLCRVCHRVLRSSDSRCLEYGLTEPQKRANEQKSHRGVRSQVT